MSKILKNTTGSPVNVSDCGITVAASGQHTIDPSDYALFARSSAVITLVGAGTLVVNDGSVDLGISEGIDHIKGFTQKLSLDSDGAPLSRFKIAPSGWRLEAKFLSFKTSTGNSLYNKNSAASDIGDAYLKFYNASNQEITTGLNTDCIRTEMEWRPAYDIYIVGGSAWWSTAPNEDAYMWALLASGIPAQYGGSVEAIAGGANLKIIPVGARLQVDGKAPKYLPASPTGANYSKIIMRHAAGEAVPIQMLWEIYRQ